MRKTAGSSSTYDVIVIGAGIGGLVCGCFLAKAGLKVLILEKNDRCGGYCTSFRRKQFLFDSAPHCFGSYREHGVTRKIFEAIGVNARLEIIRPDPSDVICTPRHTIRVWNNLERTIEELQEAFPAEANGVRAFFAFLFDVDTNAFSRMRNWTFKDLLDAYFSDHELKSTLSAPLLASHGLPPSMISAFTASKLLSDFIFDGGYYPKGGMQRLPDALGESFKASGGDLRLSSQVTGITVKRGRAEGVVLKDGTSFEAGQVVSACDAVQTFFTLVDSAAVPPEFSAHIEQMTPSLSNVVVYLGTDGAFHSTLEPGAAYCFCPHYDLERIFASARDGIFDTDNLACTMQVSHDRSTIKGYLLAPFRDKAYWSEEKPKAIERFLELLAKQIPGIAGHIVHTEAATPQTLHRYTFNYQGASYGWAGIPSQFAVPGLRKPPFLANLYLTGHWTTLGTGISGVSYAGFSTAKILLRRNRN